METKISGIKEETNQFFDYLKFDKGASPHTIESYRSDIDQALEFWKSLQLSSIRQLPPDALEDWLIHLQNHYQPASRQRKISSIRSFLRFSKRHGFGPESPMPDLQIKRRASALPKSLELNAVNDLIESAGKISGSEKESINARNRIALGLLFGCGLRVSELVNLKFSDFDRQRQVFVILGKRNKVRVVPIPTKTLDELNGFLLLHRAKLVEGKKACDFLLVNDHGAKLLRQTVYKWIAESAKTSGLREGVSPHTLRHSYAVQLLKGGADLRAVQELLGHENLETTQIYTKLDMAEVRKNYLKFHPRERSGN